MISEKSKEVLARRSRLHCLYLPTLDFSSALHRAAQRAIAGSPQFREVFLAWEGERGRCSTLLTQLARQSGKREASFE